MSEELLQLPEKNDKRRETSKANMAKARAAKLEKLKMQKEKEKGTQRYSIGDDGSSDDSDTGSSSEDEEIVIKSRPKRQVKKDKRADWHSKITELESLVSKLQKSKKKKQSGHGKQVINIVPSQAPSPNPDMENLKKKILLRF